jgi:hypothetical protein
LSIISVGTRFFPVKDNIFRAAKFFFNYFQAAPAEGLRSKKRLERIKRFTLPQISNINTKFFHTYRTVNEQISDDEKSFFIPARGSGS